MNSSVVLQVARADTGASGPPDKGSTESDHTRALVKLTDQVEKLEKSVKEVLAKNTMVESSSKQAHETSVNKEASGKIWKYAKYVESEDGTEEVD